MVANESDCRYDVFLSFRGQDTRYSFTGYLYNALCQKGFNTFMDNEGLKGGDQISASLFKAIHNSRISIVVLSQNYAHSTWCLDELVKILDCMKMNNQLVCPIFYKVAPSDVRSQTNSYGEAIAIHENRFRADFEKVQKWRSALSQIANLKGWHFESGYEYEFIQRIVEMITAKLHREQLDVGEHIIGLQSHIEKVKSLLNIESHELVSMVGIHGMGGIGKTTLAKAIYNLIGDQFECAIFLEGVRERTNSHMGLVHLQEAILSKLFEGENIKLGSISTGTTSLKDRLCNRRILLVLDDVDSHEQLEKLAGDCNWFGLGSRIIITTRDTYLLIVHQVEKRYEMKALKDHEALQLFCWNAFKKSHPASNYEDVCNRAVLYAGGLPLALKVIGSNLVGKSVEEFGSALEQYERIQDRKIHDILKITYDCLPENAKYIFLDIACFFIGERLEYVKKVLDRCDFFPAYNIGLLVDKSLLTIEDDHLRMHDLIQAMGREIVRQEAPKEPGQRSRLYFDDDILRVLTENSGSTRIEGIILDSPKQVVWSGTAFEKMNNLRILIVRNGCFSSAPNYLPNNLRLLDWKRYPSESLPPDFYPRNAVVLSLPDSHLKLEKENLFPKLMHLSSINFMDCLLITHLPDVSGVPNLRILNLEFCINLIVIHHSVGFLKKLEILNAANCVKLRTFPPRIWLPSLQLLDLRHTSIEIFPEIEGVMDMPLYVDLSFTRIKKLPDSVGILTGLTRIMIESKSLRDLPVSLFMLPKIEQLYLRGLGVRESFRRFGNSNIIAMTGCNNLKKPCYSPLRQLHFSYGGLTDEDLQVILSCFPNLEELQVPFNDFVSVPASIKESTNLRVLDVSHCMKLEQIPELPLSIQKVKAKLCPSLTSEASTMLWCQALKEVYKLDVVMPRAQTQIPNWFDHRCKGGTLSFWARRKFPVVALAFIFKEMAPSTFRLRLCINGLDALQFWNCNCLFPVAGDHVLLCDPRYLFSDEEWQILVDTSLLFEWNHWEVKCEFLDGFTSQVSYCGAYLYRHETNMEDVQFTCPNPLKRTLSILQFPQKKRMRKLLKPKSGAREDNRTARRRSPQIQPLLSLPPQIQPLLSLPGGE